MKKTELVEAAAVLKALAEDWDLVDNAPEIDFLIFVSEDREELDFYPKKSFVAMMERSGLIENPDNGSSVHDTYTYYERDDSVWREVTESGPIVFQYKITPKGRKLLRDAPKLIGKPIRELRVATSPVETQSKPLKVVTYDRPAIQKLVDTFEQNAIRLIEAALAPKNDLDRTASSKIGLVCGPRLWATIEADARRNGLQPAGSLIRQSFSFGGKGAKSETTETKLKEQPISPPDEARLFWKTLREKFRIGAPLVITRATSAELTVYPYQEEIENDDFPPPNLAGLTVFFIVESNQSRFIVVVKNVPQDSIDHYRPELSWVESIP